MSYWQEIVCGYFLLARPVVGKYSAPSGSSRFFALFSELRKQKLINEFNYCLQHYH